MGWTALLAAFQAQESSPATSCLGLIDCWIWVERVSWIAGVLAVIVGGIAAVVAFRQFRQDQLQLLKHQSEILEQVSRRPDLISGFLPWLSGPQRPRDSTELNVRWETIDEHFSEPVGLDIVVRNIGKLTARDVVINYIFPNTIRLLQLRGAKPDPEILTLPNATREEDGEVRVVTSHLGSLNPSTATARTIVLSVPRGCANFVVRVKVAMEDREQQTSDLNVRINEQVATGVPPEAAAPTATHDQELIGS